ncbi:hypothetical protein BRC62_03555 [Halobacteriales archaeon QH_10_67_13]|nr:MAG: hypothetical protein BRC62_03555 [Halobacteriales archaeon QH_10_67_13]
MSVTTADASIPRTHSPLYVDSHSDASAAPLLGWQRGDWRISVSGTVDRKTLRETVKATLAGNG